MKRILTAITAVLLIVIMLSGCVSLKVRYQELYTSAEVTPSPTLAPTAAPTTEAEGLTRGAIVGSVYTNESAELVFTAPEGWKFATDEEIEEITGTKIFDGRHTCDMFVYETATRTNVAVTYEDLTVGGIFYDEEEFIDMLMEKTKGIYSDAEYRYNMDTGIGSNTFKVMTIASEADNQTQCYFVRRAGDYMICIIATTTPENDIDSVMANFS